MKKTVILAAVACLLLAAASAFAQTKTDFSGNWTLDVSKSKVNNIESGSLSVTQTDKDITYKSEIKRALRPDGAGGGNGGGMGGGRGMGGGNQAVTYMLDGKETSSQFGSGDRTGTAKMQAKWDGGKLNLTSVRTFTGQNGEVTTTLKETWEPVDGGKALKVSRETESPRGTQTSEFYYTKN